MKKIERKTIERNRRFQMKGLCLNLASLLPPSSKHSMLDQIDEAAAYINHLKERIEKLKKKKEQALRSNSTTELRYPVVQVTEKDSNIELVLITGSNNKLMLNQVISILQQEGADVLTATFSTVALNIFYSIHAQVKISRVGVEISRVRQRLEELVHVNSFS
ncbi:transcription factor bHLH167-like [Euphorbia lathyris]|uniref:transcription factor bHLH167-like n=1 Tax=Euphorbia lathyris TaxID=212925 RepID=UPI003313F101